MRLIAIILTVASLHTSVSAFSQINLNVKSAPIENVLKQIKKQSGYAIFYDAAYLANAKPVTLHLNNASLEESLKRCFQGRLSLTKFWQKQSLLSHQPSYLVKI